jgi:DNA adenine methylase
LKWAGGKSQLLEAYSPFLPPEFGTYIEPFLGGGAMFFRLQPSRGILSDANRELIETYQVVKSQVVKLIASLRRHQNERDHYYAVRAKHPSRLTKVQRASRFVFLNRTCYNGLYRVNRQGRFNVPFGSYVHPTICDEPTLRAASRALRHATLQCSDFEKTLELGTRGDLVYLDPPYHPLSATSSFTSYFKDPFGEDEQRRLAAAYQRLDQRGCQLMLSNSDTPLVRSLYAGYRLIPLQARRAISCKGDGRGPVSELLILNYGG